MPTHAVQSFRSETVVETRNRVAYLLRATMRRVRKNVIGEHRYKNLPSELADALIPLVIAEKTPSGFYRALCERFGVDATGDETENGERLPPIFASLPGGKMRWDAVVAGLDRARLRYVVRENPALLATFATTWETEADPNEAEILASLGEPPAAATYRPTLPGEIIATRSFRTVWTLAGPMAHGADQKHGNVTLFRRQPMFDALTGVVSHVPFVSGNAVRGLWRDMVMGRWLRLIGLSSTEIPAERAHALLAGGNVEKGADTGTVLLDVRRNARRLCPPWDLFAGCTDQQIMSGRGRVHDATLVCRENAWLVRDAIAPGAPVDELAATLPEADECTALRLLVRNAHKDIPDADGVQMLANTEYLTPGRQLVHSLQVWGIDGVDPVTASCLADLLEDFRSVGVVGAQAARAFGLVAFDPYKPGPGTPALPSPTAYLDHVAKHRDEMREWAMMRGPFARQARAAKPGKPAKGKPAQSVAKQPMEADDGSGSLF